MAKTVKVNAADLASGDTAQFRQIPTFSGMTRAVCTEPANTGFDEEDIILYADKFKLKAKLISKTEGEVKTVYGISGLTIEAYTSADKHKPLQGLEPSTGTYTLGLDYARLANGGT